MAPTTRRGDTARGLAAPTGSRRGSARLAFLALSLLLTLASTLARSGRTGTTGSNHLFPLRPCQGDVLPSALVFGATTVVEKETYLIGTAALGVTTTTSGRPATATARTIILSRSSVCVRLLGLGFLLRLGFGLGG